MSKPFICHQNGKIYETQKEASSELNLSQGCISNVLKGKQPHTRGWTFSYVDQKVSLDGSQQ
jgi:hypothetical protein